MGKTISFVATEQLAEWLEEESDRRMTTISSTAQQLLAEKYREEQKAESGAVEDSPEKGEDASRGEESGIGETETSDEEDGGEPDALERNPDVWYRSDGEKNFAVWVPEDAGVTDAGGRRYYKTRAGAAKGIERWYE
jgi:hypothetical protein